MRRGVLKPLDPRPLNFPLPPYINANLYCDFHQGVGHHTDQCRRLQYAIQDLIDQKIIPPPQAPNITNNPLPNHPPQANLISTDTPFDPSHFILPSTLPKPNVVMWESNNTCMIKQGDQGNLRGNLDNKKEPQKAKSKDMCLREANKRTKDKAKEVQDLPFHMPRYGAYLREATPEPWFTIPESLAQAKTQPDWSDNLNGDLWKALFQVESSKDQPWKEASSTLPEVEGI